MLGRVEHVIDSVAHVSMKRAIDKNDTRTILQLIEKHADNAEYLNFSFKNTGTLLRWALRKREIDIVLRLLTLKTTSLPALSTPDEIINELDNIKQSFLEYIVDHGNDSAKVARLIRMPIFNINSRDRADNPMLFAAINRANHDSKSTAVLSAFLSRPELDLAACNDFDNALTHAVFHFNNITLQLLLDDSRCSVIDKAPSKDRTALSYACELNKEEAALILLRSNKFNILEPDTDDFSPFSYACKHGMFPVIRSMLERELIANHPQVIKGLTLLIKRLKSELEEKKLKRESAEDIFSKVEMIIDAGLATHNNLLHLIGNNYYYNEKLVDKLIANKNFHPYTKIQTEEFGECNFLTYSLRAGLSDTLLYKLLEKLTLVQAEHDEHMHTLWYLVKYSSNSKIFNQIVELFACDVNAIDNDGNSFLHHAAALPNNRDMIFSFLNMKKKFIYPNLKNNAGETPFHVAASRGDDSAIRDFLGGNRVDINAQNAEGKTAPMILLQRNSMRYFRCLCDRDSCNLALKDNKGKNILTYAVNYGTFEEVEYILEMNRVIVNDSDLNGNTPLHYLVDKEDNVLHVKAMLKFGANPRLQNKQGHNSYSTACAVGHRNAALYLLSVVPELAEAPAPATDENNAARARVRSTEATYQPGHFQSPRQVLPEDMQNQALAPSRK